MEAALALAALFGVAFALPSAAQDPAPADQPDPEAAPDDQAAPEAAPRDDIVLSIEVLGGRRSSAERLTAALGQEIGAPLDEDRIDEGIARLWDTFDVRASVERLPVEGGLRLRLRVVEMPVDLEPRFVGNAAVSTEDLLRWVQLSERQELHLHDATRARSRLLEGYRGEGHYFADVKIVTQEPAVAPDGSVTPADVIFRIQEGPQVHVRGIRVHGNHSMPDRGFWLWRSGLKKLAGVELAGPSLFSWNGEPFVESVLQADVIAMREVYRDRGYLDAVVEVDRLEFSADRDRVMIHVIVDEGEPFSISSVTIEAVELEANPRGPGLEEIERPVDLAFDEDVLLELCRIAPGARYEKTSIESDHATLRDYYGARGHIAHPSLGRNEYWDFRPPRLVFDPDEHTVAVTYRLVQGNRKRIREVLFSGASHTRDRILRSEVQMLEGEQADLKKISRSLRELTGTGFFSDPRDRLNHSDPTFRFLPVEGSPDEVDLEFIVEEGRVVDFEIAGGVDSNTGLFGIITLSMRNFDIAAPPSGFVRAFRDIYRKEAFHGAGQRLDVQFSPGLVRDYTRLFFIEPDVFRSHFNPTSLSAEFTDRDRAYRSYDEGRVFRKLRLGHRFGLDWRAWLGFEDKDVRVSDVEEGQPVPGALTDQEGDTAFKGVHLDLEYRDLDNLLDPKHGDRFSWRNQIYSPELLGGETEMFKSIVSYQRYWEVGSEGTAVRPSFELNLGAGIAEAFGDTDSVPYTERMQMGGIGSLGLRGFSYRGVGPNVGETPIGGSTMMRGSLELRYPLYSVVQPGTYRQVEMLRLKLFVDAGVLDPVPWSLDWNELRASVGFGFGLARPFPLAFNFGFPIEDGPGDERQVFSFHIDPFGF
jgi:outer membrane protein insertion porin family